METIIINSSDQQTLQKIKDFLKDLKVKYETKKTKEEEIPYDPEFVKMVLDASNAPGLKTIDPHKLWESLRS